MTFDPFSPSFVTNPYAHYRVLRDGKEALWSPLLGAWLLTRYEDVRAALLDSDHFSSDDRTARRPLVRKRGTTGPNIISTDPPEHTRLRRAVGAPFTPAAISSWAPGIGNQVLNTLLGAPGEMGRMDVMRDVAVPFPIAVTAEALGVPAADRRRFTEWLGDDITAITPSTSPTDVERIHRSSESLHGYFVGAIARARSGEECSGHLLESLVRGPGGGIELSEAEVGSFAVLLLRASISTVTHLIGNSMLALVRNPEQLDLLRRNPALWPRAIEELLRYDSPVQSVFRIVKRPVSVHGVTLQPGDRVYLALASANRDERIFEHPDQLQLTRDGNDHVGFGGGIHYCLGASLARLEATLALQAILERVPYPSLAGGDAAIRYAWSWTLRGLATLPIQADRVRDSPG